MVLSAGATLADLLAALGLARDLDVAAAVNGDLAAPDTVLPDNADVILMTPMEGGAATAGGAAAEGEATISTEGGTTR